MAFYSHFIWRATVQRAEVIPCTYFVLTPVPSRSGNGDIDAAEPARAVSAAQDSFAEPEPAAAGEGGFGAARAVRPVAVDDIPRDILARFHQDDGGRPAPVAGEARAEYQDGGDGAATAYRLEAEATAFAGRLGEALRSGGGGGEDRRLASRERVSRKHAALAAAAALRAGRPLDNFFDALAARHRPAAGARLPAAHRRHEEAPTAAAGGRPLSESAPALVGEMRRLEATLSGEAEGIRSLLRSFRA